MMSKHLRAYLIHAVCAAGEVAAALRDTDEYPTVLAFNGYHYRVVGLWGIPGRLLWLELERFYVEGD